jgi:preprotein translocase subunit Sss1
MNWPQIVKEYLAITAVVVAALLILGGIGMLVLARLMGLTR